ncbi:hypothetical protein BDD26_3239 [Xenorhabdus cabanillasii]|uniref:Uncharacterized protein n=1 Tax=Xenorhabdus cabanillasii TaxID=351673 RepID=A0A3D9UQV8_9GAMM|nr:hypothetical protein Xcab_01404 [Xenorhabdus cabanillasii JM26]REF28344.1 hypothetical protein BDD26_3239 [Xenorhabdus cabanillasii]
MCASFSSIDRFCHIHKIHYLAFIYTIFITVYYLFHKSKFKFVSLKMFIL